MGTSIFVSKNALVSKNTIYYLPWYNMVRWNNDIYKYLSFFLFHNLLFLVNKTEEVIE